MAEATAERGDGGGGDGGGGDGGGGDGGGDGGGEGGGGEGGGGDANVIAIKGDLVGHVQRCDDCRQPFQAESERDVVGDGQVVEVAPVGNSLALQPREAQLLRAHIVQKLALQWLDGRQSQSVDDAVVVAVIITVDGHHKLED